MANMSKKELKALEDFAKIAGLDADKLKSMKQEAYPHEGDKAQAAIALHYIRQPQGYVAKTCKECGDVFGSNYSHVAFCSDTCRAKNWERTMHVPWNLNGRGQRDIWGGEVPLIISPATMKNIEFILRQIEEAREGGKVLVQEESQEATISLPEEDQMETPLSQEFLPSPEFDPEFDFQLEEEKPSEVSTIPQSLPSEEDPFGLLGLPSFSLHD